MCFSSSDAVRRILANPLMHDACCATLGQGTATSLTDRTCRSARCDPSPCPTRLLCVCRVSVADTTHQAFLAEALKLFQVTRLSATGAFLLICSLAPDRAPALGPRFRSRSLDRFRALRRRANERPPLLCGRPAASFPSPARACPPYCAQCCTLGVSIRGQGFMCSRWESWARVERAARRSRKTSSAARHAVGHPLCFCSCFSLNCCLSWLFWWRQRCGCFSREGIRLRIGAHPRRRAGGRAADRHECHEVMARLPKVAPPPHLSVTFRAHTTAWSQKRVYLARSLQKYCPATGATKRASL